MPWKPGQSGNPAGSKPGSGVGRKPDWFINRCRELFEQEELLEFVAMVAKGGTFSQLHAAGIIDGPPSIKNRLEAVEMLKEWGFGKETQPLSLDAQDDPLSGIAPAAVALLVDALQGRGSSGPAKESGGQA